MENEEPYVPPFVRRVMKGATEEEILEATARLQRYLKAMYAIFLRVEQEKYEKEEMWRLKEETDTGEGI